MVALDQAYSGDGFWIKWAGKECSCNNQLTALLSLITFFPAWLPLQRPGHHSPVLCRRERRDLYTTHAPILTAWWMGRLTARRGLNEAAFAYESVFGPIKLVRPPAVRLSRTLGAQSTRHQTVYSAVAELASSRLGAEVDRVTDAVLVLKVWMGKAAKARR